MRNNVFDKTGVNTYSQVTKANMSLPLYATLDWSWPVGNAQVKSYPSIAYGKPIGFADSSTLKLPVAMNAIPSISISYDVAEDADPAASYDVAFDMWVSSSTAPAAGNLLAEIMILTKRQNFAMIPNQSRATIGGEEYDLQVKPYVNGTYCAFVKVNESLSGTVQIDEFIKHLIAQGYITADGYLTSIEFGNELISGTGHTVINSYSVSPGG